MKDLIIRYQAAGSVLVMRVGCIIAVMMALLLPGQSLAVQSPANCNSNRLNTSIVKDKTTVAPGDILTYTLTVTNQSSGSFIACDITSATVTFTFPAADGSPTGTSVVIATGATYPEGTAISTLAVLPYTVAVNAGVTDVVAKIELDGQINDAPSNHST